MILFTRTEVHLTYSFLHFTKMFYTYISVSFQQLQPTNIFMTIFKMILCFLLHERLASFKSVTKFL